MFWLVLLLIFIIILTFISAFLFFTDGMNGFIYITKIRWLDRILYFGFLCFNVYDIFHIVKKIKNDARSK